MKRPNTNTFSRRRWLSDDTWATKYQDGWTIWNDKDGVVGFVLTESELDGWMELRNRPRPTLAFDPQN